ncbi:MAG TPA: guanylate kinase [Dissulfurispiraceae bacterium]|nr:guanylate kinase [Dissulfurispiraceae bacterium]
MAGMPKKKGNLFVVSAPSGAGKTTLCRKAGEEVPGLLHSVSFTTRAPRPGEVQDVHYTFIDQDEFRAMICDGEFIEWAEVHGNFYGTSRGRIEAIIGSGNDVILDIDVQGARKIREYYPESTLIFVLPPSMDALEKRLFDRMSDSAEVIERRLKKAREEISEYKYYDYVIVNDLFEEAFEVFSSIIRAERSRLSKIDRKWIVEHFLKED